MLDEQMLLRQQVRASRDHARLLDALIQDMGQRLQETSAGTPSAAHLALLSEQRWLAQHLTATLRGQRGLVSRYHELLRDKGQLGTRDDADCDTA
jgi:hypothetical protein